MNRTLGQFGESWAVAYLTRLKYKILDRNVRYRVGEIDIVAQDGDELVFVEVKSRRNVRYGVPQASVTRTRYEHLASAIAEYLGRNRLEPPSYRVDVLALVIDASGQVRTCEHLKGVEAPAR
jgi:putative endonuclease